MTLGAIRSLDWSHLDALAAQHGMNKFTKAWLVRIALACLKAWGVDGHSAKTNEGTLSLMRAARRLGLSTVSKAIWWS